MKKVIFITGASSGIGHATATKLIKENYVVYCGARRVEKMKDLEELGCKIIKLDVTIHEDNVNAINEIIKNEGRIDVLFNNAGYGSFGAVEDVPLSEARYQFEVNLFSLADLTKLVIPHMRENKSGLIINTSSMAGKVHSELGAWYHSSKHAVEGFSDCLRLEVKRFGINVVILEPGLIDTEWVNIASSNAHKYSNSGEYKDKEKLISKEYSLKIFKPSKPIKIANTVSKIIKSKKPKTRYLVGTLAKPLVFGRWLLSDRIFDWVLKIGIKF